MVMISTVTMRTMGRVALLLVAGVAFACFTALAIAQAQQPDAAQNQDVPIRIPVAANEILKLATELNGLDSGVAKPWHIKLEWDEFDSDGDNVSSGTFEEFHVSPKKFKRIYTGDTLKQTDIATDSGLYRVGDQRWPNVTEYQARNAVLRPFYNFRADQPKLRIDKAETKSNIGKLPCVVLNSAAPLIVLPRPTACFQPDTVMLRYLSASFAGEASYSSIVQFQGHYVAKDVAFTREGKPLLKIHVDELGEITQVDEAIFSHPPEATLIASRIAMPAAVYLDEYVISAPDLEHLHGMNGKVEVKVVVGKDGRVIEASALNGPNNMRKAVLNAVHKYEFLPCYVLDQPVEVEFSMSFESHSR